MKKPEPETCYKCGKPKPITLELINEKTGEKQPLCKECSNEWNESDKDWPS
ncbi:unnamed protein product [marine sediment metagenome]|uniref:Uncharacterized protein n=1 Tax=marine sediment metagenome TaxID=412755 RepID=X1CF92_9ZZZZ